MTNEELHMMLQVIGNTCDEFKISDNLRSTLLQSVLDEYNSQKGINKVKYSPYIYPQIYPWQTLTSVNDVKANIKWDIEPGSVTELKMGKPQEWTTTTAMANTDSFMGFVLNQSDVA